MSNRYASLLIRAAALAVAVAAAPASASLVYDASIQVSAQGFGNVPRDLTVQDTGRPDGIQSGCVGVGAGSTITFGTCIGDASVYLGNGVTNVGGDEPNPQADNQKYGIPTLAELGIDSAGDIGILFNATEPGGDSITITDLTLKLYNGSTLAFAFDGSQTFDNSVAGNGIAGFVFRLDDAQRDYLDQQLFSLGNYGGYRMALEASFTNASGGPESFTIINLGSSTPVPEPGMIGLLGIGLLGIAGARRRKA